jgi:predicted amidohydrolase YtcJ
MNEKLLADCVLRVGAAYSMRTQGEVHRALALRDGVIVATATEPTGLDDLAPAGAIIDLRDLTLLPAFADTHEHLLEASRNTMLVPVDRARSVREFLDMIRNAVTAITPGEWVVTSMAWHESNLIDGRMPTGVELDTVAPDNPVLARRGGHLAVANTAALMAARIDAEAADPAGGSIERDTSGRPTGLLEGAAVYQVAEFAPALSRPQLVTGLERGSAAYAALGVGTIREAMTDLDGLLAYQDAREANRLCVRVRLLIRVDNALSTDDAIGFVNGIGARSGFGDDWLRIWGLKFVLDGGVEGGALEEPYANDPSNSGHLNWDPDELTRVCVAGARRGWRVATHAAGDRAVRTILDVYERVLETVDGLAPDALVIEHALLAPPDQQARAVRLGTPITVQHALLWNMGSEMLTTWGPERTARVNPLDEWVARGARLAVGTDIVRPFNPLLNVWGMVTRGTKAAGIQGPEHAIDRYTALELYTAGPARLDREADRRGFLQRGYLADIVGYEDDPLTCDIDDLGDLTPAVTIVGGVPKHDPDERLGGLASCPLMP